MCGGGDGASGRRPVRIPAAWHLTEKEKREKKQQEESREGHALVELEQLGMAFGVRVAELERGDLVSGLGFRD